MPSPLLIDNILFSIFEQTDAVSLAHCIGVSRLFAATASSSRLWKRHVAERWKRCELPTDPVCNWRKEFVYRIQIDKTVERMLQDIIRDEDTQCANIIQIADEYCTKALDVLAYIYNDSGNRSLTERYYAGRIIHRIKKRLANDFWRAQPKFGISKRPPTAPTYVGMSILANAVDPENEFDAQASIKALSNEFKAGYLSSTALNEFEKVQRLVQFLRLEKGFGAADIYYDIHNSLIHSVLQYRRGIPLSLAVVFQAISHVTGILGVDIMSFPGHVVIRHTEPDAGQHMFIDLFQPVRSIKAREDITFNDIDEAYKKCIFTQEQCEDQLLLRYGVAVRINAGPGMTPSEIYARCMRNIMSADANTQIHGRDDYIRVSLMLTRYSTHLQMAVCYPLSRLQLEHSCIKIAERYYPEDIDLLSHWVYRSSSLNSLVTGERNKIKRRARIYDHTAKPHVWPVGTIVTKGPNGPYGAVVGWQLHYENDFDQPIAVHDVFFESTEVGRLDFRPDLCDFKRNLEVVESLCSNLHIGQYFSHFDLNQLRFVPNDILQQTYPNDYTE